MKKKHKIYNKLISLFDLHTAVYKRTPYKCTICILVYNYKSVVRPNVGVVLHYCSLVRSTSETFTPINRRDKHAAVEITN